MLKKEERWVELGWMDFAENEKWYKQVKKSVLEEWDTWPSARIERWKIWVTQMMTEMTKKWLENLFFSPNVFPEKKKSCDNIQLKLKLLRYRSTHQLYEKKAVWKSSDFIFVPKWEKRSCTQRKKKQTSSLTFNPSCRFHRKWATLFNWGEDGWHVSTRDRPHDL